MNDDDAFWRDLMPEPGEAQIDPRKSAQAGAKPALPKRFYETATAEPRDGGFALLLDGRGARTPGKRPLVAPNAALGEALAAEWRAQGAEIDPATMPLTRLVNSAIDGVSGAMEPVAAEIVNYAGSDLVCYRAGEPEKLVAAQSAAWDPILASTRAALDARFVLAQGVMFVAQPEHAIEAVSARVAAETSPFALAALNLMTTLTGSALIALAVADGRLSVDEAWAAAHVDEAHQESLWGTDALAAARRANRERDFRAAAALYAMLA